MNFNPMLSLGYLYIEELLKSIRFIPVFSQFLHSFDPNKSETNFQSELILARIDANLILNPNNSDCEFIEIDSDCKFGLDQCKLGLIWIENLVRNESD